MEWGLDGDIILYSVGFASQDDPVEFALKSVRTACSNIMYDLGASRLHIYLTGAGNYRETIVDDYKANRRDVDKPIHYKAIKEYMIDTLGAILITGEEADDAMGYGATLHGHGIATLDKDLDGVPGLHYNWKKRSVYYVSPEDADRFFYTQLITGDSTDNIPGLFKRTGVKAMAKTKEPIEYMDDPKEMYAYVKQVYVDAVAKKGMSSDDTDITRWLLTQGRLLWIRRAEGETWAAP